MYLLWILKATLTLTSQQQTTFGAGNNSNLAGECLSTICIQKTVIARGGQ